MAAEVMDGEIVRQWLRLAADALGEARSAIDVLNVFPVADADTGTNLHQTIACAAQALAGLPPEASTAEVWRTAVSAALHGACGNSGIILSQMLRGLADTCGPASRCDGEVVAAALMNAAMLARAAVQRPAEGTVLTVADAAALAASRMTSLAEVTREAAIGARLALAATPRQLAALAVSGVVDAGAAGLCVVLDALSAAISGTAPGGYAIPAPDAAHRAEIASGAGEPRPAPDAGPSAAAPAASAARDAQWYEVTYLVEAAAPLVAELRSQLDQLGDSLVVSGGDGQWHVHVHVADAGAAIETGLTAGQLSRITVTHLPGPGSAGRPVQVAADGAASEPGGPDDRSVPAANWHLVVTQAEGAGLVELLRAAGARVTEDAAGAGCSQVHAVRPGRPKITIRHNESAHPDVRAMPGRPAAVQESVIEIGSPVQALAALAVHDPARGLDDDAATMRRAVAGMRYASVARGAAGTSGPEFVGQIADQQVARGPDQAVVARAVIDRLLAPGAELVTLLTGLQASPGLAELAAAHVRQLVSAAEVACYDGGMAGAALLIGAE